MKTMLDFVRHIGRMPVHWRIWVVVLFLVNMAAIFFLPRVQRRLTQSLAIYSGSIN